MTARRIRTGRGNLPMQQHSTPSPIDPAWAAGLIDGEGSIEIARSRVLPGNGRRGPCYYLKLRVTNRDLLTLEHLRDMVDGTVRPIPPAHNQDAPLFVWSHWCRNAAKTLSLLEPYLVTKRQHVKAALAFHRLADRPNPRGRGLNEQERTAFERCWQVMRALNAKGKAYSPADDLADAVARLD